MKISDLIENTSASFAVSMGGGNGFANGGPGVIKRAKSKKRKTKESIYSTNKENPNNPEVLITGYGRLSMDALKSDIERSIEDVLADAKAGDWDNVEYKVLKNGVMKAKMEALFQALKELEQIRSRGGKNSRGIEKR